MELYQLKYFFWELIGLSFKHNEKPGLVNACSYLIENLVLNQEFFLGRMLNDYTNESNEFRLNGAGLKLYWIVERKNIILTNSPDDICGPVKTVKFKCRVGGDQAKDYPEFVQAANSYINSRRAYKGYYGG